MARSIKLDEELKNRIHHIRQQSAHRIMEEAKCEEARENFKQEALASWTVYQETGRHLRSDEVRNWLNTWGTDKKIEIPKCHK